MIGAVARCLGESKHGNEDDVLNVSDLVKYFFLLWCLFFWYEVCSRFSEWTHVPLSNLKHCFFQFGTRQCDAIGFEMLATSVIFITAVQLAIFLQIQIVLSC